MSLEYEWDEVKATSNHTKHGVSFEAAKKVFQDPFAIERLDDRHDYGEVRFVLIGMSDGQILFVAYTERQERIRIISARRATRLEQDDYIKQNI